MNYRALFRFIIKQIKNSNTNTLWYWRLLSLSFKQNLEMNTCFEFQQFAKIYTQCAQGYLMSILALLDGRCSKCPNNSHKEASQASEIRLDSTRLQKEKVWAEKRAAALRTSITVFWEIWRVIENKAAVSPSHSQQALLNTSSH